MSVDTDTALGEPFHDSLFLGLDEVAETPPKNHTVAVFAIAPPLFAIKPMIEMAGWGTIERQANPSDPTVALDLAKPEASVSTDQPQSIHRFVEDPVHLITLVTPFAARASRRRG